MRIGVGMGIDALRQGGSGGGGGGGGFDISTATFSTSNDFSAQLSTAEVKGLAFNPTGTQFTALMKSSGGNMYYYTNSTGFDFSSRTYVNGYGISGNNEPTSIEWAADARNLLVCGQSPDEVQYHTFSADYSSAFANIVTTEGPSLDISATVDRAVAAKFNADGTLIYVLDRTTRRVYAFSLSTPYVLTTGSYTGVSSPQLLTVTNLLEGMTITSDFSTMFISCIDTDTIYQFTMGGTHGISTLADSGNSLDVSGQTGSPLALILKPDDSVLYMWGQAPNATLYEYTL